MTIRVEQPNPDGLDEVFEAYHTLGQVLRDARLVPDSEDETEEQAAEACVEEVLDMLGSWLERKCGEQLQAREK